MERIGNTYVTMRLTPIAPEDADLKNAYFYTKNKIKIYDHTVIKNQKNLYKKKLFRDFDIERDRYGGTTGVETTDVDKNLNLSRLTSKDRRTIAMVGSYPLQKRLGDFFRVIYNQRPSIVVNLVAAGGDRPEYFVGTDAFGDGPPGEEEHGHFDIETDAVGTENFGALQGDYHNLSIRNTWVSFKDRVPIPMLHITNWADKTIPSFESIKALALRLN